MGIYNIVSGIISERDKAIEDVILELVEQGSRPEDLTLEYNAFTQFYIVRDTVKGYKQWTIISNLSKSVNVSALADFL